MYTSGIRTDLRYLEIVHNFLYILKRKIKLNQFSNYYIRYVPSVFDAPFSILIISSAVGYVGIILLWEAIVSKLNNSYYQLYSSNDLYRIN